MKKIHVSAILILLVVMSSCAGLILNFKNSQLMSIQKGMTQQELADLVNVRRETIVRLENGNYNPTLSLAVDIARVFEIAIEEIFIFE